jgi:hypothetical protein
MPTDRDIVVITGSSGFFGRSVIKRLAGDFGIVGFDQATPPHPPPEAECICIDLTSEASLAAAFARVRFAYGDRLASVIHLAAYFDLTGKPNPKYEEVTVRGTERLLEGLRGSSHFRELDARTPGTPAWRADRRGVAAPIRSALPGIEDRCGKGHSAEARRHSSGDHPALRRI